MFSTTSQEMIRDFFLNIWKTVKSITIPFDILDILLIAFIVYYIIKLVRDTRAMQFVKGILLLMLVWLITKVLPFRAMGFLMDQVFTIGATAMIVVFQPELRRALERVGRTRLPIGIFSAQQNEAHNQALAEMTDEFREAAESLSRHKIGALMVFEMQTKLGEIIKTGTGLDCKPVSSLICNIFFPNSPLHDGAMIIRDGRIRAAGCFLPLTETNELSKELGTRHRASVGMSENSDAIIVVVSEETGVISVARGGTLTRGYTPETLGEYLRSELLPEETGQGRRERRLAFRRAKK